MLNSLYIYVYLAIFVSVSKATVAYEIPALKAEILKEGFRVSIPDEPSIRIVFYAIDINSQCPPLMGYITQPIDNFWTMHELNRKLQENDALLINVMVQHEDEIYTTIKHYKVHNNILVYVDKFVISAVTFPSTEQCEGEKTENVRICVHSATEAANLTNPCVGDPFFQEEFNELNLQRWTHDIRLRLSSNEAEEFCVFDNAPNNCFIKNNLLHIMPTVSLTDIRQGSLDLGERCTAAYAPHLECDVTASSFKVLPPVYSAQIHTRNSFSFKYGRIDIRAKLPKGDWILPYLMLQPTTTHAETYHAPQIRIAFARGNVHYLNSSNQDVGGSRLYGGLVLWQNYVDLLQNMQPHLREIKREKHFGDDFHTYMLTWTKDSISMAVDGEEYGKITQNLEKFRQECFIILGVSVGGHLWFEDTVNSKKPWQNTSPKSVRNMWLNRNEWQSTWSIDNAMQIDYIRVYAVE